MMITAADLEGESFRNDAHYNMGKAGYGYGYRSINYPRLRFIDKTYRQEQRTTRTWYVDGAECPSYEDAIEALNKPPVLTDEEKATLEKIPQEFVDARKLANTLAGCEREGARLEPGTPHYSVRLILTSLHDKGVIEYGRNPERSDGQPWDDIVPEHLRWSPTIRRC